MEGAPFRQIWVEPAAITTTFQSDSVRAEEHFAPVRKGRFCRWRATGLVEGGDWDRRLAPYDPQTGLLYSALQARYYGEKAWTQTAFFESVIERLKRGERPWNNCRNVAAVHRRCARADRLIDSVKASGFHEVRDAVSICIGPDGQLIKAGNGQHRIMLGLIAQKKIPVQVIVRHRHWEDIRTGHAPGHEAISDHPDMPTRRSPQR